MQAVASPVVGVPDVKGLAFGKWAVKFVAIILLGIIAVNAVVLPNSQQSLLIMALAACAVIALTFLRRFPVHIVVLLLASWSVTLLFTLIGSLRGAPSEAAIQTIIIYIVSPLLWLLVIDLGWKILGTERIIRAFTYLAILASATVMLYMYLFLNFGPQAVRFFSSNANVHLEEGYSGVIMHVSGSLIFLGAAFAAEPTCDRSRQLSVFTLCCLVLAILASGRTIAILGLFIGVAFFLLTSFRHVQTRLFIWIPILSLVAFFAVQGLDLFLDVDALQLLQRHVEKVQGGDYERPAQMNALLLGMERTWFLGAGHGIGVDYVRSENFPWRYEAVIVALAYKIGLVGTFIVLYPILAASIMFIRNISHGSTQRFDAFFGSALIACLVAGFTNPYPEAFSFHWMYLVPAYYFLAVRRGKKATRAFERTQGARKPMVEPDATV